MGRWNHRAVRRVQMEGDCKCVEYAIHEAFYDQDKPGDRPSITLEPVAAYGDTIEELRETLQRMLRALDHPVLDYETHEEINE